MQKAEQADFNSFDASSWKIGIVVAQFNRQITDKLYQSAILRAQDYGLTEKNFTVIKVTGAIEIPLALQRLARTLNYQALLAIGCVIQGDTPHFDYVCKFVSEGILKVQLETDMPIGFGILTVNDLAQAEARAGLGGEHLDAVMQQTKALEVITAA